MQNEECGKGGKRSPGFPHPESCFLHSGFTLVELLLVVAIALIAAGIAVPLFSRSFQGSQLRAATRQVVMTAKYARSMAVLKQRYMAILFDRVGGSIEVVALADRAALAARSRFLSDRAEDAEGDGEKAAAPITSELRKPLPADIRIDSFQSSGGGQALDDIHWVNYYPNGMSDGFEVLLADKSGGRARVTLDGLSGDAKVEFQ